MKITPNILSIPPYISTSWQQIAALHVRIEEGSTLLFIDLVNGSRIEIPHLDDQTLAEIFYAHTSFLEGPGTNEKKPLNQGLSSLLSLHLPTKFLDEGIEKIAGVLKHNPESSDTDDLPQEILDKVSAIAQSLNIEDTSNIPVPIEGCNCLFCQISRTIQKQIAILTHESQTEQQGEELVTEEDLRFKTWDIEQHDNQLYQVTNPLDRNEHYNVFLGQPIGCTCGNPQCEHIAAVLRT